MKFLHVLTLFLTLGLALAREFFTGLGLQADYPTVGALGLALTTLLVFRGILAVLGVALISLLISLPPELLRQWSLDRDMLMAAALVIILFPWLDRLLRDG